MARRELKLTKSQARLMRLFNEIEDEDIREIMAEVVLLVSCSPNFASN